MTCLFLTIEASSGDPVNHSFMVWCFGQRAACEIGSLKLSDLKSSYSQAGFSSTFSCLNGLVSVQACRTF